MNQFKENSINLSNELKTNLIESFTKLDQFCRHELPKHEPIVPLILFGAPLIISMLLHIIENGDLMIIKLDVIFFALLASCLCIIGRDVQLFHKFITNLIVLNLTRIMADITAFKLILFALLPWLLQIILEELKHDINDKKQEKKDDEKQKQDEEAAAKKKKDDDDKKEKQRQVDNEKKKKELEDAANKKQQIEDDLAAAAAKKKQDDDAAAALKKQQDEDAAKKLLEQQQQQDDLTAQTAIVPEEQPIEQQEIPKAPPAPKPTKKYLEEHKETSQSFRKEMDIKGDRAYLYLIKRFRKHSLGTFFQGDYIYTTDINHKTIQSNMEILLKNESTHPIWTHMYSTEFKFSFPEDINPKGRDVNWEIDTFLLYSALCRILSFENETQIIFKHYNTLQTTNEDNIVITSGYDGVKIVLLPGENQPYLVRYLLKMNYTFNAKENKYVEFITSKGLVEFKLTPYIGLKDVNMCLKSITPTVAGNRNRMTVVDGTQPNKIREPSISRTTTTPNSPSIPTSSSRREPSQTRDSRNSDMNIAFVDSSLKK